MENKSKKVRMTVCVFPELHREIRIAAAKSDLKYQEFIIWCIEEGIKEIENSY